MPRVNMLLGYRFIRSKSWYFPSRKQTTCICGKGKRFGSSNTLIFNNNNNKTKRITLKKWKPILPYFALSNIDNGNMYHNFGENSSIVSTLLSKRYHGSTPRGTTTTTTDNEIRGPSHDPQPEPHFKPRQTGRVVFDPNDTHNSNFLRDHALPNRTTIVFQMVDQPGNLEKVLKIFSENHVNLTRIESRYGATHKQVNFFVDVDLPSNHRRVKRVMEALNSSDNESFMVSSDIMGSKEVPWFPITMKEVDSLALLVLEGGSDLEADHPGFNDKEYRERRQQIADFAASFEYGDKPQRIKYSEPEIECWSKIWKKLNPLLYKHACPQYLEAFEKFQKHCGYQIDHIPQLADVTDMLYHETGFRLRPTAGLISSRHFLNGLAFRVFFCTQYLRHHSVPFYTPEPDVVHELVGHAPLFANPQFAQFSQEIGLASIGATDEQIVQLARCYWFSVEFGLCRSNPNANDRKIYGAGILSSFGEIDYSMSDEPEIREWDPFQAAKQDFPITKYQPVYYIAQSFEDAKDKLVDFAESFDRPFSVKWNDVKEKLVVDRNIRRGPRDMQDFGEYIGNADDDSDKDNNGNK